MPVYIYMLILSDPEFKYNDQLLDYVSLERQKKFSVIINEQINYCPCMQN